MDTNVDLPPGEKRLGLIAAMAHFRPKTATPIQFYNYVREFCIMHDCSIDEAMARTPDTWTKLGKAQRELYNSKMHAALPIPVPRHQIYCALKMERAGRWKISAMPTANGASTTYSMESYAPPIKPTKRQTRLRAQQPRFDNLAESSLWSPTQPKKLQAQQQQQQPTSPAKGCLHEVISGRQKVQVKPLCAAAIVVKQQQQQQQQQQQKLKEQSAAEQRQKRKKKKKMMSPSGASKTECRRKHSSAIWPWEICSDRWIRRR
ncbi:vacuolar protein-sorting-associated protein 36 isoform X2 [Drosophila grimshawi]|uniref:vacuolar protein-sorting-associated protein 36 isoform X2 n=1 Tax=Drosophila grimshawi TaxID=7222 RepID=UPI000C8701DA|nr:vacuolar protein-sorting-associated protein 36 isoform X2 [Drosophila grimshawi]